MIIKILYEDGTIEEIEVVAIQIDEIDNYKQVQDNQRLVIRDNEE